MKFLHVSDIHLGKRLHGRSLKEDQDEILAQIEALAARPDVDAVLIAGDVYHRAQPGPDSIDQLSAFLTRLKKIGKPVFIVRGNHDGEAQLSYAADLLSECGLHLTNLFDGTLRSVLLSDEYGPVRVWLMPYIKPIQARRWFPDDEIETYADAVRSTLRRIDLNPDERNVLVTHQYVFGAQLSDSEELAVGGLDQIPAEVFDDFDYVALGHLHRAQTLRNGKIRYCGAPLVYSFDECSHEKSATLVTLGPKGTPNEFEFVPFQPLHRCRRIEGTLAELCAQPRSEDYIQALLTDEIRPLDPMGTLMGTWPNALALQFTRLDAGQGETLLPEMAHAAAPIDHFTEFFTHQTGHAPSEQALKIMRELLPEEATR